MPERAAYDEAILLSQVRLKVQDPELTEGKVEKFTIHTAAGAMERPWGLEGGFAVVYKFCTRNGDLLALRCFRVAISPDTQFRYERLGPYFATHIPLITAKFKYHEKGIIVKENVQGQRQSVIYPVIEMEWIKGVTLIERIDELCRKRDRAGLEDLLKQWTSLIWTLRQAQISHGDLAGANLMVRDDGRLVLVDYDGVYIPEFANTNLAPLVVGQADYQHPQMQQRPFNEYADDFSALVIYTALLALHLQPQLWDKYTQRSHEGKLLNVNILFLQQDFVDPERSVLISDLAHMTEERMRKALQHLKTACKLPVDQVRFPVEFIDPDAAHKEALVRLEQAIKNNDDDQIITRWTPGLQYYAPAQQYAPRVVQARQIIEALRNFRVALKSHSVQQIVSAYDTTLLDACPRVTPTERQCFFLAQSFMQAYQDDDDQALAAVWDEMQGFTNAYLFNLSHQEQQRLIFAQQRKQLLLQFRMAIMHRRPDKIVAAYDASVLDNCKGVTTDERDLLRVTRNFVQAYQNDDDEAIVASTDEIQNFAYRTRLTFSAQEQRRIEDARLRKMALIHLRMAIASKKVQQIAMAYDDILDSSKSATTEERALVRLAKNFVIACHKEDDHMLITTYNDMQSHYHNNFVFSPQEQQRITRTQQLTEALEKFRQALASKQAQRIVADYNTLLDTYKGISIEERNVLHLARQFVQSSQKDDDQAIVDSSHEIQHGVYQQAFLLSEQEQQRIRLAQQRKKALIKFRMALLNKRASQIATAYDPILDDSKNVTVAEREQLELARNFLQAYQDEDDKALVESWDEIQNFSYRNAFTFTPQEQQRVTLALQRKMALVKLRMALMSKSIQPIIAAYDSTLLDRCKNVTTEEAEQIALVQRFWQAMQSNHNQALLSAWSAIQNSAYRNKLIFTDQEQQRITQAQQHKGSDHA